MVHELVDDNLIENVLFPTFDFTPKEIKSKTCKQMLEMQKIVLDNM